MLYNGDIQKYLLISYRTAWENQPTRWFSLDDLIKEKDFKFLNKWEIKTIEDLHPYMVDLHESDCLERMKAFFKITRKGRTELETTYNRNYIDPHQQLENKKRLQEKQERDEDRKDRKMQHDEMVQVAKDANKWIEKGMIIAMIVGALGLIVAIFGIVSKQF